MPFRPLAELSVSHPYFGGGVHPAADIRPDAPTAARLRGLRLLTRVRGGRLTLLADWQADGTLPVSVPDDTRLGFWLAPLAPEIAAATDLAALGPHPLFTDAGVAPDAPLRLEAGGGAPSPGRLARIEIGIGPATVAAAADGEPLRHVVPLGVRAARWCFHVVTDDEAPLADWRIERGNGGGPAVAFGAAGGAELAADSSGDPFGVALWQQSRPARVLRFLSDAAVPPSEEVAPRMALMAGTRRLMEPLPNPAPADCRRLGTETVVGAVLHHRTR
jgi:hypothetical protein